MGLGKTAQSIAVIAWLRQYGGVAAPVMVVAPLTTLGHWQREIATWTGLVRLGGVLCWMSYVLCLVCSVHCSALTDRVLWRALTDRVLWCALTDRGPSLPPPPECGAVCRQC
jgi:SNF2-related domain